MNLFERLSNKDPHEFMGKLVNIIYLEDEDESLNAFNGLLNGLDFDDAVELRLSLSGLITVFGEAENLKVKIAQRFSEICDDYIFSDNPTLERGLELITLLEDALGAGYNVKYVFDLIVSFKDRSSLSGKDLSDFSSKLNEVLFEKRRPDLIVRMSRGGASQVLEPLHDAQN